VPFFESEGRTATFGATLLAVASLARTPLRVLAGWWLDRVGSLPRVASVVAVLHAAVMALLAISTELPALVLFVILWGFGGAVGPLIFSLASARTFGTASFATVSGALLAVETASDVVLPPLGGLLYDRQGSYDMTLSLYAVFFLLAAVAWHAFGATPSPRAEPVIRGAET
jgi:predicted MFS family arabinose efflux permease